MQKKLTVSQLNNYINGVFSDEYVLRDIDVEGEIFEISVSGGRTYFTLKENDCQIQCVSFSALSEFPVGTNVCAGGSVNFYKKSGKVTFIVRDINVCGEGRLLLEFLKLKSKLQAEGLFDNKRQIPKQAKKICIITSGSGAVVHDIISVVRAKNILVDIAIFDVQVQGSLSSEQISNAISAVNGSPCGIDVIIVARGGGSASDLAAFNTEQVARSVAASRIPIVSAVGHETDFTLCDLCASARAGTPSIAAEMVVSSLASRISYIMSLVAGMRNTVSKRYTSYERRLTNSAFKMTSILETTVRNKRKKCMKLCTTMLDIIQYRLKCGYDRVHFQSSALDRLSPLKVLRRGYAKILMGGKEVASSAELHSGDYVEILLKDGKRAAEIK